MDTDEFLVHYDHGTEKISFDNILDNLSMAIYDGILQKVNFLSFTTPDQALCEDPLVGEHGPVFVAPFHSAFLQTAFKAVLPSASLLSIDLDGHSGITHSNFNNAGYRTPGVSCPPTGPCFRHVPGLSVLHCHYGCMRTELENLRKAMLSHGYVSQNDTVKEQIAKLVPKSKGCAVASCHKVRAYYAYITNPSVWEGSYYKNLTRQFGKLTKSLELHNVMVSLEAKYSDL